MSFVFVVVILRRDFETRQRFWLGRRIEDRSRTGILSWKIFWLNVKKMLWILRNFRLEFWKFLLLILMIWQNKIWRLCELRLRRGILILFQNCKTRNVRWRTTNCQNRLNRRRPQNFKRLLKKPNFIWINSFEFWNSFWKQNKNAKKEKRILTWFVKPVSGIPLALRMMSAGRRIPARHAGLIGNTFLMRIIPG